MQPKQTNVLIVTIALFVSTFMAAVEGTIVSTAMPTIIGDLHGVSLMNWVFSIFLLTNAIATPIYGKLADTIGRKRVFIWGLVIFVIGSTLSGFAQSMHTLILWRALQGIGAGSIMPVSFTIIADIYPFEKRAKIMGFNGSAWGIASIVAPLLGGFIVDQLTWHWVFFINIPVGLLAILMIAIFLQDDGKKQKTRLDWVGSLLLSISLLTLMYGFQILGQTPLNYWFLALCSIVSAISFYWFVRHEKQTSDPIIPMTMFSDRTFVTQNLVALLISGFLMGFEVYLPTWTQGILGLKASMAGFAITPSSLMWIVGSFIAGRMLVKMAPKQIVSISLCFILIGGLSMALIPQSTAFGWFFLIAAICGTGFGITITTTTVTVQARVNPEDMGVATSLNTLGRTLGQTLMMSVFGIVMNQSLASGVAHHDGVSLGMVNKLINPQTAHELSATTLPVLRNILYGALHHVFIVALLLIILAFAVNLLDRPEPIHGAKPVDD